MPTWFNCQSTLNTTLALVPADMVVASDYYDEVDYFRDYKEFVDEIVSLPISPHMTNEQIDRVIYALGHG